MDPSAIETALMTGLIAWAFALLAVTVHEELNL